MLCVNFHKKISLKKRLFELKMLKFFIIYKLYCLRSAFQVLAFSILKKFSKQLFSFVSSL